MKNISMKDISGFTLIELLIVIAIIGILAAVALPAYQGYTIRAKLVEVQNAMATVTSAVTSYREDNQSSWPDCPTNAEIASSLGVGLASVTSVSNISVSSVDGTITAFIIKINPLVDTKRLTLKPNPNDDGSYEWVWGWSEDFPVHFRPKRN